MSGEHLHGFYLGDLLIEPLKGRVTGRSGAEHLPPKAAEVLLRLAATPGELVTRETLLNDVWGEGGGSQEALGHAISEIRHSLDDHAEDPKYIQTVRGRGYRLIVSPQSVSANSDSIVIGAQNGGADLGFFENVKRRGVLETAIAYLVFGWLIIQVADVVFAQLHLPDWAGTYATAFVIAGFPIALILSWFLEFRDGKAVVDELSPRNSRRRRFSRTYMSVIGALVVASILVYAYDSQIGLPSPDGTAEVTSIEPGRAEIPVTENSIAVLPFLNVDGSNESQVFANGLVDDVINRLARVPGLRVSSRGDSFTLDPNSASDAVRQRLRVAMYLEGSVQIASDRIRVIVQLINSSDGFHVLSRTFDRPREDFFDIRDEVTNLTVSSLRVTLPAETQALSDTSSRHPDLDAYILYRRGVDELLKPRSTAIDASALGWFDAALAVDPEYAAAYAGKCSVYANSYQYSDDPEVVVRAEAACARALERNPNLYVVHNALGGLNALTGKYDAAQAAYTKSLNINPDNVPALTGLSDVYRLQRQPEKAEETLLKAAGLEPGNWRVYNHLGYFYYQQGRYADAAEQYDIVVSIDSRNTQGFGNLAASHMLAGNFAAAAPAYERSIELEPQPSAYSNLGLMQYYLGNYDAAATALRSAIEMAPNDHLFWSNLGDILRVAGKSDDAHEAFLEARHRVDTAFEVNPNDPAVMMDHAWILAMLDERDEAMLEIDKASERLPDDPYTDYIRALIHTRYGEVDAALAALESASEKGYSVILLGAEPQLRSLHENPRFVATVGAENIRN